MSSVVPRSSGAVTDLGTFARRVARFEPEAVVRLIGSGTVLACFAETPFDALAMRAMPLAEPADLDIVVEAQTLAARAVGEQPLLELPAALPALRWTTSLPPRTGWEVVTVLPAVDVVRAVDDGVEEFRRRAPEATAGMDLRAGRAALEGLAAQVWDRELIPDTPLRLAHAATSYRFLPDRVEDARGEVVVRRHGSWRRLDAPHGSIVARSGLALFAL